MSKYTFANNLVDMLHLLRCSAGGYFATPRGHWSYGAVMFKKLKDKSEL